MTKLILILPILVFASSCASVTRGSTEALEIKTNPPGADVYVTRTNSTLTEKEIKKNMTSSEADEILSTQKDSFYGPLKGKSPAVFTLKREGEYRVNIEKDGYKSVEVKVTHETSGAGGAGLAGNIILGGGIGMLIDSNTGATQDLVPNPIEVELEKEGGE